MAVVKRERTWQQLTEVLDRMQEGRDHASPVDFDGDPRPLGAGFDIGFDELNVRKLFLPLVLR